MRVIAGKYRGRPLRSLRETEIRPTSDRLRETLFNILTAGNPEALKGTLWLDLFAGTGAVGIEALSRGAAQIYFVENAPPAANLIEQNLHSLGIAEGYKILQVTMLRLFCGGWNASTWPPTWFFSILPTGCSMPMKNPLGLGGVFAGVGDVAGDCRARKDF